MSALEGSSPSQSEEAAQLRAMGAQQGAQQHILSADAQQPDDAREAAPRHRRRDAGTPLPSAEPTSVAAADALPQDPPAPAPAPAAADRRLFLSPTAAPWVTPLSWADQLRFVVLECCTVAAALLVGFGVMMSVGFALLSGAPTDALLFRALFCGPMMPAATLAYLGLLYARSKREGRFMRPPPPPPLPSRGRTWAGWPWLLAIVAAVVIACWRVQQQLATQGPSDTSDWMLEASLDDQWAPAALMGLVEPVAVEIFFRGLLFARCARFLGLIPAAVLSSVAFGWMHGSTLPQTSALGMAYAGLYVTTGSLLAPMAGHATWNSAIGWMARRFSPMAPLDSVAEAFEDKYAFLKGADRISCASDAEARVQKAAPELDASPEENKQRTIHITAAVFTALDRGGKGQLDASEIAWLMSLRPDETRLINAVVCVVERRVGGDEDRLLMIQRNMDRMPADVPLLDLPTAKFIGDDARRRIADEAKMSLSSAYPAWPPFVQHANAGPLIPIDPRVQAMQTELIRRYYSIQWTAFYRAQFPSGCDRAAFETFFCRAFPSYANDERRVLLALSSSVERGHSVAALLEAHRAGRQSFGGVTRRRALLKPTA